MLPRRRFLVVLFFVACFAACLLAALFLIQSRRNSLGVWLFGASGSVSATKVVQQR